MQKIKYYDFILLLLVFLEILFLFYFMADDITNQVVNSFGFFFTSLAFGIVLIKKYYAVKEIKVAPNTTDKYKYIKYLMYVVVLLLLFKFTRSIVVGIDYNGWSDIIPSVRILAQRLLDGKDVYTTDAWYPIHQLYVMPGYLTMHWLPVSFAEYYKIDARYVTFSVWAIGATILMIRSYKCRQLWLQLAIPILVLFSYYSMYHKEPGIVGVTVEIMIAGYYTLLIYSINQNSYVLNAFFITCCLLSRYYIIFWLPLWCLVLYLSGERKRLFKTIAAVFIFVSILYILPFVSKNTAILNLFSDDYEKAAIGEWSHFNKDGLPTHLYVGNGFAYLFYQHYAHTDLLKGFHLLKKCLLVIPALSVMVMGVWYWYNRTKINNRIFLMASFKIYLTFFLSFILVPYSYLMITGVLVSIALFAEQARYITPQNKSKKIVISIEESVDG